MKAIEITQQELDEKLKKHWQEGSATTLDFSNCYFSCLSFHAQKVKNVNFDGSYFFGVDFSNTTFDCCYFQNTDFCRASVNHSMFYACLFNGSKITDTSIFNAYFSGCDFVEAEFDKNSLCGSMFSGNFLFATFTGCSLDSADFSTTYNLDIGGVNNLNFQQTAICPEKGSFIAYKAAIGKIFDEALKKYFYKQVIVELEIPEDAKRCNATGRKCRASKVKVLNITHIDGKPIEQSTKVQSYYDPRVHYKIDDEVEPVYEFEENRMIECASGIHFFMTRDEAIAYLGK